MSKDILSNIIDPALEELAGSEHKIPMSQAARAMLLAIGLQESRFEHRFQLPQTGAANRKGPARGYWQFEAGGGVRGVLGHQSTAARALAVCRKYVGSIDHGAVWASLEYNDRLACIFARLLLWTDSHPLPVPAPEDEQTAWNYYLRNWRPGAPHPETWGRFWRQAVEAIG